MANGYNAPDGTANPNATPETKAMLQTFWNAANNGKIVSGAQIGPSDCGEWWHLDTAMPASYTEWEQYKKTTGYHPKIMAWPAGQSLYGNPAYVYGNPTTGNPWSDTTGIVPLWFWGNQLTKMIEHSYSNGGFLKLMDVPQNFTKWQYSTALTAAGAGGTTITAINTAGSFKVSSVDMFGADSAYPMSSVVGGQFTIVDTSGIMHYGTYTGVQNATGGTYYSASYAAAHALTATTAGQAGFLTGVVIGGTGNVINGSVVSPAILDRGKSNMSTNAKNEAWHLLWDANAWTKLNVDVTTRPLTASGYAQSLSVNANYNFNRYLDYLSYWCYVLQVFYGIRIPVILRLFPEPNVGAWWYSSGKTTWYRAMWKYAVAYLSGNPNSPGTNTPIGYVGQPVAGSTGPLTGLSGTPTPIGQAVTNALYMWGESAGNSLTAQSAPPGNLVDLVALEEYNKVYTSFAGDLASLQGYSGMANKPSGMAESYSQLVGSNPVDKGRAVCTTTDDVKTATTITMWDDWSLISWNSFAPTNSSMMVPTEKGMIQVNYASVTYTGPATSGVVDSVGFPVGKYVFIGCSPALAGNPSGCNMVIGAIAKEIDTLAGTPSTYLAALKAINNTTSGAPKVAFNILWDGSTGHTNNEMGLPGYAVWQTDSAIINRESRLPGNWQSWGYSQWSFV